MTQTLTAQYVADLRANAERNNDDWLREVVNRLETLANTWDEMVWVIVNTHGVVGLRADGSTMHWREVFDLYVTSARDLP